MTTRPYIYPVDQVVKVTDGDTFWLRLDVGFRELLLVDIRLSGYDCPELNSGSLNERAQGKRARDVTTLFLGGLAWPGRLWVRTEHDPDSFGRWLGDVWVETPDEQQTHLGDVLRQRDLASVWPTRWRDEFDAA